MCGPPGTNQLSSIFDWNLQCLASTVRICFLGSFSSHRYVQICFQNMLMLSTRPHKESTSAPKPTFVGVTNISFFGGNSQVWTHDFSTLSIIIITVPSQGAELFPSAAVKISLPGHHPVELVVPRREFFWPWGGNQRQGGHWCGSYVHIASSIKIYIEFELTSVYIHAAHVCK